MDRSPEQRRKRTPNAATQRFTKSLPKELKNKETAFSKSSTVLYVVSLFIVILGGFDMGWKLGALLSIGLLLSSCAIPRHGGVFAMAPVTGGGLVDRSADYSGSYIRATNREGELGRRGGSPDHRHSIAHQHEG